MDYTKQSPVILSLCTGMRGLENGYIRASDHIGWQRPTIAAYVEREAMLAYNLVAQMEQGVLAPSPIWTDLTTFPSQRFRNKIHGIIGGYPCQPFSVAGKGAGTSDPRHIWPYIKEIINTINPVWCFFENVRNHVNIGFEQVREDLQAMDYTVNAGIFSAEEVGAPHKRERLFILAVRNDQLANAYNSSVASIRRDFQQVPEIQKEECESKYCPIISDRAGEELDNSFQSRLEGHTRNEHKRIGRQNEIGPIAASSFPMGQGYNQHLWEESRVKSRLDFTINGYDFTEDLLRMAGNGVVEQTAELAFITLLKKFST